MDTTFTPDLLEALSGRLRAANQSFNAAFPGESGDRQAVHTVYGGAQIFKADTAAKMGRAALHQLQTYAPNFAAFAKALEFEGSESLPASDTAVAGIAEALAAGETDSVPGGTATRLAWTVYNRVLEKLRREPVEDFRIDFEDGFGNRPDDEEDAEAERTAGEVIRGLQAGSLPPFIGIRIKALSTETQARAMRTLDIFVATLANGNGGRLPANFVVTLPKVTMPEQVASLVELFELLENRTALAPGALQLELMVETPQSLVTATGEMALPGLVAAAKGRCVAAHFGVYDFTASTGITAAHQSMTHAICDFARHMMKASLAGTAVRLSDGATNIMPLAPHKAPEGGLLTAEQMEENRLTVHGAWKLGFNHITHSLQNGFYQGWDLHPAQLPVRYAALYKFFLEGWDQSSRRLRAFIDKAAQASLLGNVFDDAATGQALLNYFLRGLSCGAISEAEIKAAGLSLEDIQTRSFKAIMDRRQS